MGHRVGDGAVKVRKPSRTPQAPDGTGSTGTPAKYDGLSGYGMEIVERVNLATRVTTANLRYLVTKAVRMGHDFGVDTA